MNQYETQSAAQSKLVVSGWFAGLILSLLIVLITFSQNAWGQNTPVMLIPNAVESKLDNGLRVIVIPDNRAPVVTHMLWYKAGAADEPAGRSGIAHFLEHLMFKGTKNHPDGHFSNRVAAIGGQENAFTSKDYTGYFQRIAPEHLEEIMMLEADRMKNLVLTDDVVDPEREVVLEERSSRVGNDPSAQLSEAMNAAFYKNHPYGRPIIGWEHEIKALSLENALEFYDDFYTPENAILIVAGDVTEAEVLDLALKTYGQIPPRAGGNAMALKRQRPMEPPATTSRTVTLTDERVAQPSVRRAFAVPSYHTSEGVDAAALSLLSEILSGGSTSRIYRALVLNDGPATAAGGWYQGSAYDSAQFFLYGVPKDGIALDKLIGMVQEQVDRVGTGGVTQDELDRARNRMIADTIYAQDNQATMARIIGAGLTTGQTLADIQSWPSQLAAVTKEDVQRVAAEYLNSGTSVTGFLKSAASEADDNS